MLSRQKQACRQAHLLQAFTAPLHVGTMAQDVLLPTSSVLVTFSSTFSPGRNVIALNAITLVGEVPFRLWYPLVRLCYVLLQLCYLFLQLCCLLLDRCLLDKNSWIVREEKQMSFTVSVMGSTPVAPHMKSAAVETAVPFCHDQW